TEVTWTNSRGGSGTATGSTSWTASGVALQSGSNVLTITARDAAGNTGTASITATYANTPPSVSITAPAVGATRGGTVTVPAAASLDLTTAMTLEAWVYPTGNLYKWNAVLIKEQPGEFLYALYSGSSSHRRPYVYFNTSTTSAGEQGASGSKWLPFNAWSHLAGTYDSRSLKPYVNGQLVRSQ